MKHGARVIPLLAAVTYTYSRMFAVLAPACLQILAHLNVSVHDSPAASVVIYQEPEVPQGLHQNFAVIEDLEEFSGFCLLLDVGFDILVCYYASRRAKGKQQG